MRAPLISALGFLLPFGLLRDKGTHFSRKLFRLQHKSAALEVGVKAVAVVVAAGLKSAESAAETTKRCGKDGRASIEKRTQAVLGFKLPRNERRVGIVKVGSDKLGKRARVTSKPLLTRRRPEAGKRGGNGVSVLGRRRCRRSGLCRRR